MLHLPRKKALLLPNRQILRPQDVFQSRLRTGTGATAPQSVGWRPDLVWSKNRGAAASHYLFDTDRGATKSLSTDLTNAQASNTTTLTSFDAAGYTLGISSLVNGSGSTYVDWLFKDAPGFFQTGVITHISGTANNVDLSALGAVGMVVVKNTSSATDWPTWHRSFPAGTNAFLNTTAIPTTTGAIVSVSGTTMTLAAGAATGTYEYYAFAHQPNGIIQCGLYSSINGTVSINVGWDVQYLHIGTLSAPAGKFVYDISRGLTSSAAAALVVNTNAAEAASGAIRANPNGWTDTQVAASDRFYMVIKKAP